jgi:hypothetical protein
MSVPANATGQAAEAAAPRLEAVMGKAIPTQHPAVVLRSHYRQLRALLAIAMVAVVGLTAAVVILANNDDVASAPETAVQFQDLPATHAHPKQQPGIQQPPNTRYDGGPEEGTRGALSSGAASSAVPGTRYDGGPEEGTRGALSSSAASSAVPGTRYDGGPEEGSRGSRQ